MNIKRIFISGPITPRGRRDDCPGHPAPEYVFNIQDMVRTANWLIRYGYSPFCPGLDFLNFFLSWPQERLIDRIERVDLDFLEVCEAILMMPGWEHSAGAKIEHARAVELGLKIFYSLSDVPAKEEE